MVVNRRRANAFFPRAALHQGVEEIRDKRVLEWSCHSRCAPLRSAKRVLSTCDALRGRQVRSRAASKKSRGTELGGLQQAFESAEMSTRTQVLENETSRITFGVIRVVDCHLRDEMRVLDPE